MSIVWFFVGLAALVAGAELLVRGASKLSLSFGISPLVVGLTVVAFGTSAPEMAVSVQSAWVGQVDIAIGNVVGSNIFNVLFILGVSALITPLVVNQQLIRQEVPVMIAVPCCCAHWPPTAASAVGRRAALFVDRWLHGIRHPPKPARNEGDPARNTMKRSLPRRPAGMPTGACRCC